MSDLNNSTFFNNSNNKTTAILFVCGGCKHNFDKPHIIGKKHAKARTVKVLPEGMRSNLDGAGGREIICRVGFVGKCSPGGAR